MKTLNFIQAVAFDLDGTLVDSVPDLAAAANAMRLSMGMNALPQERVQSFVGDGINALVHRALNDDFQQQSDPSTWEQGFTAFMRYYDQHIADHTRPYPQTQTGLGLLKTLNIPLAVITNKNERLAIKLLKSLKLEDYFSIIIGGDSLPQRKPNPAPLLHVAEVLGVTPENMLMVGDSINDILAAKAAHCPSAVVTFGYGNITQLVDNRATKPDMVIATLPEIYDHIHKQQN